ncbi:MAG: hypothetical protein KDC54_00440 [Lewinella sp.]|nr:hypothetical protein [Lewinella sp.]
MRLFRRIRQVNWKYIVGEVLLIFVGINLAIWFNNWNTAKSIRHNKALALTQIEEEISNNLNELGTARENNDLILAAFHAYEAYYASTSSELVATPAERQQLEGRFPDFFRVADSSALEDGRFQYQGETFINFEIAELTEIAWMTTQSMNIAGAFDYPCLYELESMYSLQRRVRQQIDLVTDVIQGRADRSLINALSVLGQLDEQLENNYHSTLESLANCR